MDMLLQYKTYIALFLSSGLVCYFAVPWARRLAIRLGACDAPSERRVRVGIPTLGGLGVALAFYLLIGVLFAWPNLISETFFAGKRNVMALLLGGLVILALGIYDDIHGAGACAKLPVQILAALIVCGVVGPIQNVHVPLMGDVVLGVAAVPITVLWIVGITNAFNLIDGIDGLAAGVGGLVFGVNFFIAYFYGHVEMMVVAAVMCGALLAFLRYNYYPAQIFLGDTGSLFVGFIVAVTSLLGSLKAPTTAMMMIPIGLLGYPILDVVLAVVRRAIKGKPIFSCDRSHIHHKLLFCGLGHRLSSAVAYAYTLAFAGIVVCSIYGRHRISGMLVGVVVVGLLVMFHKFGYWDFMRRNFSAALRRRYRLYHLMAEVTTLKMAEVREFGELWKLLQQVGEDYDLHTVEITGVGWERCWVNPAAEEHQEIAMKQFRLHDDGTTLHVRHNGGKNEDIELEQNLLLENISKTLACRLEQLEEMPVSQQTLEEAAAGETATEDTSGKQPDPQEAQVSAGSSMSG